MRETFDLASNIMSNERVGLGFVRDYKTAIPIGALRGACCVPDSANVDGLNTDSGAPLHFTVQISTDQLEHVERLRELFTREWGQIDAFEGLLHGKDLPRPLVALDNSETLLGGLAFSTYKHPSREGHTLWINALLVIPSHRSNGIASRLVKEAECVASELGFNSLHVHTNVPSLYQRLGWRVVSTAGQHPVLTVDLDKPSR